MQTVDGGDVEAASGHMVKRNLNTAATACGMAAALLILMSGPGRTAEAGKPGPEAFNNHCRTCHSVKEGDNRMGPSLARMVGRKAGTVEGYPSYSQSLKSSGITWDEATLDKFITDPEAVVHNNNMKPFKAVTDPAVRKKIVDYLQTLS